MKHRHQWLLIGTEDSDATSRNPGSHQPCNHAIGREQSIASLVGILDKHIWTESESGNLARTSRIYRLLTVDSTTKFRNTIIGPQEYHA